MFILIVEDNPRHQQAAVDQLKNDHAVTVVDNWPKAEEAIKKYQLQIVMTDLMLPSTSDMLSDKAVKKYPLGTEMPLGFIVALHAALNPSVQGIAILMDRDRHSDPVDKTKPKAPFNINGKKFIFSLAPMVGKKRTEKYVKDWKKALDILMS